MPSKHTSKHVSTSFSNLCYTFLECWQVTVISFSPRSSLTSCISEDLLSTSATPTSIMLTPPCCECKTIGFFHAIHHMSRDGLRGFRPGPTQTGLYSHRRWLETWNLGFRKQRYCTIQVAKTKALISFAVTAKLICVFVFAYAKIRFLLRRASYNSILTHKFHPN